MFEISLAAEGADLQQARMLFREYVAEVDAPCCFITFDREMASLPGAYASPQGRLFLARSGEAVAGCVAMRPLAGGGEMKRLYVRPPFRGSGLGRELAKRVISAARDERYARLFLDTLPKMREAIGLYHSLGFRECGAYCPDPTPGARYFEIRLS